MGEVNPNEIDNPAQKPENEPAVEQAKKAKKAKRKAEADQADKDYEVAIAEGEVVIVKPDEYDDFLLPEDSSDPYWDAKMEIDVPNALIKDLAAKGWDRTMLAKVKISPDGKKHLSHGKTRWRALPAANSLRKKAGLPPIEPIVLIEREFESDDAQETLENVLRHGLLDGMGLNLNVQKINPMAIAEDIVQALSGGITEKEVAEKLGMSLDTIHGYQLLFKLPEAARELVKEGTVSFAAALELARKVDNMTASEINSTMAQIAKAAAGGAKVTAAKVKRAAGEDNPATKKEIKQTLLDLQSGKLDTGKYRDPAKWAAILALELGLGTRTLKSFWNAMEKISGGQTIKVDFAQYQVDGKKKDE